MNTDLIQKMTLIIAVVTMLLVGYLAITAYHISKEVGIVTEKVEMLTSPVKRLENKGEALLEKGVKKLEDKIFGD